MIYQVHSTVLPKKGITLIVIPKAISDISPYFIKEMEEVKQELNPKMGNIPYHYWFEVTDEFVSWFKESSNAN